MQTREKNFIIKRLSLVIVLIICTLMWVNFPTSQQFVEIGTYDVGSPRIVYAGGFPIGLSIKPNGVIVTGIVEVETVCGRVYPNTKISEGDILMEINGKKILYASEIFSILEQVDEKCASIPIKVNRCGKEIDVETIPVKEDLSGRLKLGLAVKDSITGMGTVTFIKKDQTFTCLGHAISGMNNHIIPCHIGSSYDCKIMGYHKGVRGKAGELKGAFTSNVPCGELHQNTKFGLKGKLNKLPRFELKELEVGSKNEVKPGKAKVITTIGERPEEYDIEIIKANSQMNKDDKSMVLRITDKRLLTSTGGILQGMSGSPIVQNNKLVGAVTHVFINDPTKGYGIYADWMYDL